jgi:small subunit ribosomal protein S20
MIAYLFSVCYILSVGANEIRGAPRVPARSKRDNQSLQRHKKNKAVHTRLKNLSKAFFKAVDAGEMDKAAILREEAQRSHDKAATKGVIHPNKAARKTSRFDKALVSARSES